MKGKWIVLRRDNTDTVFHNPAQPGRLIIKNAGRVYYVKEKGGRWLLHREDGPASQYFGGAVEWYIENKRHRLEGPCCITKEKLLWSLNGKMVATAVHKGGRVMVDLGETVWITISPELWETLNTCTLTQMSDLYYLKGFSIRSQSLTFYLQTSTIKSLLEGRPLVPFYVGDCRTLRDKGGESEWYWSMLDKVGIPLDQAVEIVGESEFEKRIGLSVADAELQDEVKAFKTVFLHEPAIMIQTVGFEWFWYLR